MASDSPAATIASHSPKNGGFQAAGAVLPGLPAAKDKHGSVPVKMAGALCRKGGKGRRAARSGASGTRDRTAAGHGLPLPERAGRTISPEGGQHRRRPGPEGRRIRRAAGSPAGRVAPRDAGKCHASRPGTGQTRSAWKPGRKKQGRSAALPGTSLQILVREAGLEPAWINRWILSPVRLPIPPLSQRYPV